MGKIIKAKGKGKKSEKPFPKLMVPKGRGDFYVYFIKENVGPNYEVGGSVFGRSSNVWDIFRL